MFKSSDLDNIGRHYQTDKCSGSENTHDYLRKYEFFFKHLKKEKFVFLELGVFKGASLKTWADYFEEAEIIGVDCVEETAKEAGGRKKVILGDISKTDFLSSLMTYKPKIIIDDASHWWPDQLRALFTLYPEMDSGGIYIVEDIHTSFEPLAPLFQAGFNVPPFLILQKVAEYMTGNEKQSPIVKDKLLLPLSKSDIFHQEIHALANMTDAITFIERAVILVKK